MKMSANHKIIMVNIAIPIFHQAVNENHEWLIGARAHITVAVYIIQKVIL